MTKTHRHTGMLFAVVPLIIAGLIFTAMCAMMIGEWGAHDWFRWPDYVVIGCFAVVSGLIAMAGYIGAIVCLRLGLRKCTGNYTSCQDIDGRQDHIRKR